MIRRLTAARVLSLFALHCQAAPPWSNRPSSHQTQAFAPLTFSGDRTFQISIFEDLHFGESESTGDETLLI
jgi:hypothetical protein